MSTDAVQRHRLGLVVGKFAPLHRGHEALLAFAARRCERLLVLSYTRPEFSRCEPAVRRAWFAARVPQLQALVIDDDWLAAHASPGCPRLPPNAADDATHQAWLARFVVEELQAPVDALFASEPYLEPTARRLAEALGRPVAAVAFDPGRLRIAARASLIRADPHRHRDWLAPEVYASFVERIAFVGGESTGKSTLSAALAARYDTTCAPEFGREWWAQRDGRLDPADLLHIARVQIEREELSARLANRFLFCDTTPLVTCGYSQALFDSVPPALAARARRRYDRLYLCRPDFDFVQDGTRRDDAFRRWQHRWLSDALAAAGVPYVELHGSLDERIERVVADLAAGATA